MKGFWYVCRVGFAPEGLKIRIMARCATEQKAQKWRVLRRIPPTEALIYWHASKVKPGNYTGAVLDYMLRENGDVPTQGFHVVD